MKNQVVWMDSNSAHVFDFKTTGIEKKIVNKHQNEHHNRHKNDMHEDPYAEHFYQDLSKVLMGADQLLIMGPGLAKNHFKDYLIKHQEHLLAKNIIGLKSIESFEHMSEKQMIAKAHQYFKTYDLFNSAF